jgi:excisionase family DNA binding protein
MPTDPVLRQTEKIAAGYAALVADFVAASEELKQNPAPHAKTLAAAYGAFAAGYTAASAAAAQIGATEPFALLSLPGAPAAPSPFDVMTLPEVAAYLRLAEDAVREEAATGRLTGQQVRGEWRFLRAAVLTWLRAPRVRPTEPTSAALVVPETDAEYDALMASVRAHRDGVDRATGFGAYADQ